MQCNIVYYTRLPYRISNVYKCLGMFLFGNWNVLGVTVVTIPQWWRQVQLLPWRSIAAAGVPGTSSPQFSKAVAYPGEAAAHRRWLWWLGEIIQSEGETWGIRSDLGSVPMLEGHSRDISRNFFTYAQIAAVVKGPSACDLCCSYHFLNRWPQNWYGPNFADAAFRRFSRPVSSSINRHKLSHSIITPHVM